VRIALALVVCPRLHVAQPQELIPIHPVYNIQDWDAPRGAIDWPRFSATLQYVKTTSGDLPPEHSSHDHLNAVRCPLRQQP
jgi:nicotinamide/nicotinate riboside kinase